MVLFDPIYNKLLRAYYMLLVRVRVLHIKSISTVLFVSIDPCQFLVYSSKLQRSIYSSTPFILLHIESPVFLNEQFFEKTLNLYVR